MFDKMLEIIGDIPYAQEDVKIAGYLLFKKLLAVSLYSSDKKIKGPVTLIKATENFVPIEKDHNLSRVRDFCPSISFIKYICNVVFQYHFFLLFLLKL